MNFKQHYTEIVNTIDTNKKMALLKNCNLIIFGYSTFGRNFAKTAKEINANLVAFLDNYFNGFCQTENVPIIKPEKINEYDDTIIFLGTLSAQFQKEMREQLISLGINESRIVNGDGISSTSTADFEKTHYNGYERTFNLLADEKSKNILLQQIKSLFGKHEFEHSNPDDQYFESDVISFTDNEVFVNGGCYDGATDKEFIKRVGGSYRYIYAFEPDPKNYVVSSGNLKDIRNLELVNKGLFSKDDTLFFAALGIGSSKIDETAKTKVHVVSLDSFFKDKLYQPTFIKMDIEGAELEALKGVESIIRTEKPKLAICVYHKIEDIYEIPEIIQSYGEYNFYLRRYRPSDTELVLYAIPKKGA
ncbi:MAG: FkbM family methyltransferase [Defluviitaleaceae bacterium]|nr:FkbM family methyltransferase [Defluviitaleaceae bacterium]